MVFTNMNEDAVATLLFVDRDRMQGLAGKIELEARGYRVFCTQSGSEALQMCQCENIDLVVGDSCLPDIHGLDLIGEIVSTCGRIPIIINTADVIYKLDFRSWAADAIVERSSGYQELVDRVAALLQTRLHRQNRGSNPQQLPGWFPPRFCIIHCHNQG